MKCEHCGKHEINFLVDGLRVCAICQEKSEDNFLVKCVQCGTYGYLERNEHTFARLAMANLLAENIEVNEATFNIMIANIQIARPTVVQLEACPNCYYSGEGHA